QMGQTISKVLGVGPVKYNAVEADVYRSFGFPGADEMGNMFQAYRDFDKQMLANRSVDVARKLNPSLQSFEQFVTKQKAAIKTAMGILTNTAGPQCGPAAVLIARRALRDSRPFPRSSSSR